MHGYIPFTDLEYDPDEPTQLEDRGLMVDDGSQWWLAYEVVFPLGDFDQVGTEPPEDG